MREVLINNTDGKELFYESGRKGYFIGALNGTIPQIGYHIKDRMCGLWFPPHRILGRLEWYDLKEEPLKFERFETLPVSRRVVLRNADSATILTFLMAENSKDFRIRVDTVKPLVCRMVLDSTRIWDNDVTDHIVPVTHLREVSDGLGFEVEGFIYRISTFGGRVLIGKGMNLSWVLDGSGELRISNVNAPYSSFRDVLSIKERSRQNQTIGTFRIRRWVKNMLYDFVMDTEKGSAVVAGFPEYPWWFGVDIYFTGLALLLLDVPGLALSSFKTLMEFLVDGVVPHEVNLDGKVIFSGRPLESLLQADLLLKLAPFVSTPGELREYFYLLHKAGNKFLNASRYPKGSGFVEIPELEGEDVITLDNAVAAFVFAKSMYHLAKMLGFTKLSREYEEMIRWYEFNFLRDWYDPEQEIFKEILGDDKLKGITFNQVLPLVYRLVDSDTAKTVWESLHRKGLITHHGLKHSLSLGKNEGYYGNKDEKVWWIANALLKMASRNYGLPIRYDLDSLFEEDLFSKGMPGVIPEIVGQKDGCFAQAWSALYAPFIG